MKLEATFLAKPQLFYIRPAPGWISLLEEQVKELITTPFQKYKFTPQVKAIGSSVRIQNADFRQALEILYRVTLAQDMLWLVSEQKCESWSDYELFLKKIPLEAFWRESKPETSHLTIKITEAFTQNAKKLREKWEAFSQTKSNPEEDLWRFFLELRENKVRLLVSLSGELLFKRKYKAHSVAVAPLAEHHAAACIFALQKSTKRGLLERPTYWVPFAGSGTFGFEAFLSQSGVGGGAFEREFACEEFSFVPLQTLSFLRRKCREKLIQGSSSQIVFNEVNEEAVQILKDNCEKFFQEKKWKIIPGDFFELDWPFEAEGSVVVLLNPPFGDRLGKKTHTDKLFRKLAEKLKKEMESHPGLVAFGCLCPSDKTWGILKQVFGNEVKIHTFHFTQGGKAMRWVVINQ